MNNIEFNSNLERDKGEIRILESVKKSKKCTKKEILLKYINDGRKKYKEPRLQWGIEKRQHDREEDSLPQLKTSNKIVEQ